MNYGQWDPEAVFSWVLDNFTPADVLLSPTLFARFQAFLAKGTVNEKRQLCLLGTYQPTYSDIVPQKRRLLTNNFMHQRRLPLLSPTLSHPQPDLQPGSRPYPRPLMIAPALGGGTPPAKSTTAQEKPAEQTREQTLCPLTLAPGLSTKQIAFDYFRHDLKIEDASQLERLAGAAVGFIEKPRVELQVSDIWSRKSEIFDLTESNKVSRICRLFRGRQRLSQDRMLYDCADRLSLVFIHHEVSEKMRAIDPVLSKHQRRITVACRDIAQELGMSPRFLKNHRDNGRCYLELFLEAGPGDLLALGPGQSTVWERSLKIEDVTSLIKFRQTHFPQLERQVRDLDGIASVAMISGLIAYGWTLDELSTCQGLVAQKLKQHADLSRLSHQKLQASQSGNKNDNRSSSVGADDIVFPVNKQAEQLSTLGSVAPDSSKRLPPCVDSVNQQLQLPPLERICCQEPPTSGAPNEDDDDETRNSTMAGPTTLQRSPITYHGSPITAIDSSKEQPSLEQDSIYPDHAGYDDNAQRHRQRSEENVSSRNHLPPLFPDYPDIFDSINFFPEL